MVISEITAKIEAEHTALMVRPREGPKDQPIIYDVKESDVTFTERDEVVGNDTKGGGFFLLDAQTAHAMNLVRKALAPKNQAMWDRVPLRKLVAFAWDHVK